MAQARVHGIVRGMVQGVGYRWFVQAVAQQYGLTGWVCNRADGTVEAEAEGDRGILVAFVERLKEGPRSSEVEQVDVQWSEPTGDYGDFEIR